MPSRTKWFHPNEKRPSSISLIAHGLNLSPKKMNPLIQLLTNWGSSVAQISLTGHEPDEAELFPKVTRSIWLDDLKESFEEAQTEANRLGIPLYFVGYSIGSTLAQDLLNQDHPRQYGVKKQVLLAPAIAVRPYSRIIRALRVLGPEFWVPSLSYADYHAHHGTPVAAYNALFESIDAVLESKMKNSNIPTLVLVDPRDELISTKLTRALIEKFSLSEWKVTPIRAKGSLPITYHHLIVDELAVGTLAWGEINRAIQAHLFKNV